MSVEHTKISSLSNEGLVEGLLQDRSVIIQKILASNNSQTRDPLERLRESLVARLTLYPCFSWLGYATMLHALCLVLRGPWETVMGSIIHTVLMFTWVLLFRKWV